MKPGSNLVLIENVIPETPDYAYGKWLDLHMMVVAGGRERTAKEYRELWDEARRSQSGNWRSEGRCQAAGLKPPALHLNLRRNRGSKTALLLERGTGGFE